MTSNVIIIHAGGNQPIDINIKSRDIRTGDWFTTKTVRLYSPGNFTPEPICIYSTQKIEIVETVETVEVKTAVLLNEKST
jgi:hypothetical protein